MALEEFLAIVFGPDWQQAVETLLPGSSAQMRRDAAPFVDSDLPPLCTWEFVPADAKRIRCLVVKEP